MGVSVPWKQPTQLQQLHSARLGEARRGERPGRAGPGRVPLCVDAGYRFDTLMKTWLRGTVRALWRYVGCLCSHAARREAMDHFTSLRSPRRSAPQCRCRLTLETAPTRTQDPVTAGSLLRPGVGRPASTVLGIPPPPPSPLHTCEWANVSYSPRTQAN